MGLIKLNHIYMNLQWLLLASSFNTSWIIIGTRTRYSLLNHYLFTVKQDRPAFQSKLRSLFPQIKSCIRIRSWPWYNWIRRKFIALNYYFWKHITASSKAVWLFILLDCFSKIDGAKFRLKCFSFHLLNWPEWRTQIVFIGWRGF